MDHNDRIAHFQSETSAFEKAVRHAFDRGEPVPAVPSCPGWTVSDLVAHLGGVHRFLAHVLRERLAAPPDPAGFGLPQVPAAPDALTEWFAQGARELAELCLELGPHTPVWTWSPEQTSGFWLRMQLIELAVHRWDAQSATGTPGPLHPHVAADAVTQTCEVMAPARRSWKAAPAGTGERYRFRSTDGPETWTVVFAADEVLLECGPALESGPTAPVDVEATGTASDLALFLWGRLPATALRVTDGDATLLPRWFTLVPPV
ncbi:maleylpyruvate isomerase family mycothiol-dependent enzyme [Streptomyces sp. MB09-01]|uniref:maleylpyruvate isomerase family mycothiol-dependent enzyme n=1 Tax=Streptomyces sp. MB09-01 TaxID=3028666 RepID=UPI0029B2AE26|nr:maleylpyruvate isomerase family mycothiol-dependent enzyme [Streptomyces sp. MB09-01]MDX3535450.1 maleylpyruvate isomerase family mycothiol-dependent enzyme [Streptomyces sp. MB09-01]